MFVNRQKWLLFEEKKMLWPVLSLSLRLYLNLSECTATRIYYKKKTNTDITNLRLQWIVFHIPAKFLRKPIEISKIKRTRLSQIYDYHNEVIFQTPGGTILTQFIIYIVSVTNFFKDTSNIKMHIKIIKLCLLNLI